MANILSKGWKVYQIAGLKALWLTFNRYVLKPDFRGDFVRFHIEHLSNKEELNVAEIGVWEGDHAKILQEQLDIDRMYLIDPYDAYEDYEENKSETERMRDAEQKARKKLNNHSNIKWIKDYSDKAIEQIDHKLDYVYIDGNHKYKYVKKI